MSGWQQDPPVPDPKGSYDDGYQLGVAEAALAFAEQGSGRVAIWQRGGHIDVPLDVADRQEFLYGYAAGLANGALAPRWPS